MHHTLTLGPATLHALPSGALHWPAQGLLVVSDLHLGKAARLARRGGALLPPYETRATLEKLDADIARTAPGQVICLGDSFDDLAAGAELDEADTIWLSRLMAGRNWTWIEGNHDPGPLSLGGTHRAKLAGGSDLPPYRGSQRKGLKYRGITTPRPDLQDRRGPVFWRIGQDHPARLWRLYRGPSCR